MPPKSINSYGDRAVPTTGQHGYNISEQRLDELDQACLDFIKSIGAEKICVAVDIGGGSGAQSKRMSEYGASVLLIDLTDQNESINFFNRQSGYKPITFIQEDVCRFQKWPASIDCVYSQRMLGYIRYADALKLLRTLKLKANVDARFFLSASGLKTEYGTDYSDRRKPVEERFACLSSNMQLKHNIPLAQCLYSEIDLRQLVEQAGFEIIESWTSTFGNPKIIARNS